MTSLSIVLDRLDALVTQCDITQKAINSAGLNTRLSTRVAAEFLQKIRLQREQAVRLRGKLERTKLENRALDQDSWTTLQDSQKDSARLFGECLAFLQAARARGQDVEADLCEIADALLDELTASLTHIEWNRFTVLAAGEFFSDFVQIIRLRFPFCGIWDLPVAAHEFGHFVATQLNITRPDGSHTLPLQEYKSEFKKEFVDRGDEWMFYIEEYFADVFATYTLGPAYACTCLLLRFDPAAGHSETDKRHPSYARRAYAILQTLLRMNTEADSKAVFKPPANALDGFWREALTSAGKASSIEDESFVGRFVSSFYEMLKAGAPRARFNRWNESKALLPLLREPALPPGFSAVDLKISDILNAAWLCRLEPGADARQLSDRAIRLCRLLPPLN